MTPMQGANLRRRVGALASSIMLLVVTAPGPAIGLRMVAPRGSPGCPTKAVPVVGRADVLGVRMRTDDACRDAVRLMASFHACLRASGDEASCRSLGPSLRPDTTRLTTGFLARSSRGGTEVALGPADPPELVSTEAELRKAWADPLQTSIKLTADIFMRSCKTGGPIRESLRPLMLDGNGFTIRQTCFEKRILRQDATGFLVVKNITLTRGGNDGPGAAITTRGEIVVMDSVVMENLAEEPGGAVFSQRGVTVIRSIFTGNFAWDDGGAVYARRGGVKVYDSVLSNNLVDGSGGAIGTTGDILVVRSHVDGNTTDGDGGALYADEDGDVTVVDSTVDGNTADGPGGAIFTLDGDVTVVGSTLNGNRADDRGGAISGEADVLVVNSTIARNAAVAHVGGGVWARSDAYFVNSTISNNYAEGQGGGIVAAGTVGLVDTTVTDNVAPVASNVGGTTLLSFGSLIGPPSVNPPGGIQPPGPDCRIALDSVSSGFNVVTDGSCALDAPSDVQEVDVPLLGPLDENGGFGETRMPLAGSLLLDRIPAPQCGFVPFGESLEGEQHLAEFGLNVFAAVTSDQRGMSRPEGLRCDVGAVEGHAP